MPNIKQQERRVTTAARQRLENLRWRSASKTLFRRLESALEEDDAELIAAEHRLLVQTLDKAAAQRAIHPNKAARKKAQAAKLVSAGTSA
jgi:small subunit ribosomal protein S20